MHDLELFHMKPSETIGDLYTYFTDIINGLKALGKRFLDFELVNKILRSFHKNWDSKVIIIQEAKDLNKLPLEELIGSLMTSEMTNVAQNELKNNLPKNRKDFRIRTIEDHSSISSCDGELELLTMKFKKFMK